MFVLFNPKGFALLLLLATPLCWGMSRKCTYDEWWDDSKPVIPFIQTEKALKSLDTETLLMLGISRLEQYDPTRPSLKNLTTRYLLHEALTRPECAPSASYLCGLTVKAAFMNYIPALYELSLKYLAELLPALSNEQQAPIQTLFQELQQEPNPHENYLLMLKNRSKAAGCSRIVRPNSQGNLAPTFDRRLGASYEAIYKFLATIAHGVNLDRQADAWKARACYILSILYSNKIGFEQPVDQAPLSHNANYYLYKAAQLDYEPALWKITRNIFTNSPTQPTNADFVRKTFLDNVHTLNYLVRSSHEKQVSEHAFAVAKNVLNFISQIGDAAVSGSLRDWQPVILNSKLYKDAYAKAINILQLISSHENNPRAKILLALDSLAYDRSHDSLYELYDAIEQTFTDSAIRSFFTSACRHEHRTIISQLHEHHQEKATFLLGLLTVEKPSAVNEAYQYFAQAAKQKIAPAQFLAARILEHNPTCDKTCEDPQAQATYYYEQVIRTSNDPLLKEKASKSLRDLMQKNCIPARCALLALSLDANDQRQASEIVNYLENLDDSSFTHYIRLLTPTIMPMAEQGDKADSTHKLLGYIYYDKATQAVKTTYKWLKNMHKSLRHLRLCTPSERSKKLMADSAFQLGRYHLDSNARQAGFRLLSIAHDLLPDCPARSIMAQYTLDHNPESLTPKELDYLETLAQKDDSTKIKLARYYLAHQENLNEQQIIKVQGLLQSYSQNNPQDYAANLMLADLLATYRPQKHKEIYELYRKSCLEQLTEKQRHNFALACFAMQDFNRALSLTKNCPQTTPDWLTLLCCLYTNTNLEQAFAMLEKFLVIKDDTIKLPQDFSKHEAVIWHTLLEYTHENQDHLKRYSSLIMRLYCALSKKPRTSSINLNAIINILATQPNPDSLLTLAYLFKHGIIVNQSHIQAIKILADIIITQQLDTCTPTIKDQLKSMIKTIISALEQAGSSLQKNEETVSIISTCVKLVEILIQQDPDFAISLFFKAHKLATKIKMDFKALVQSTYALQALKTIHQQNFYAAATIIEYMTNLFLLNTITFDVLYPELLEFYTIQEKLQHAYILGQDPERDKAIGSAYGSCTTAAFIPLSVAEDQIIRNTLIAMCLEFCTMEHCFFPQSDEPLYKRAEIMILFIKTKESVHQGIKLLKELTGRNYKLAFFDLALVYDPMTALGEPWITPNKDAALCYYKQGAALGDKRAQDTLAALNNSEKKTKKRS